MGGVGERRCVWICEAGYMRKSLEGSLRLKHQDVMISFARGREVDQESRLMSVLFDGLGG